MIHILNPNLNFDGLIVIIIGIMLGPAVLLVVFGGFLFKKRKKLAKVLFILATVYLIVSLGVCGALISGL